MNDKGTIWDKKGYANGSAQTNTEPLSGGLKYGLFLVFICLLIVTGSWGYMWVTGTGVYVGCGPDEFIVLQSPNGRVWVISEVGIHFKGLATYWVYPRRIEMRWGPVSATFNDGKMRGIKGYTALDLPTDDEARLDLHIKMGAKISNIEAMTEMMAMNAVKLTATIMSGREVLSYRKAEFSRLVDGQMSNGFYQYEQITDPNNNVWTTIAMDSEGKPVVSSPAIFSQYGLTVSQVSIIGMDVPPEELRAIKMKWVAGQEILKSEMEAEYQKAEEKRIQAELAKIEQAKALVEALEKQKQPEK